MEITKWEILPGYRDLQFKHLFGIDEHKKFTCDLLESFFNLPSGTLRELKILNSVVLNAETIKAKDFILDVLVELPDGMQLDLESYSNYDRNARVKDFFYLSSLYSKQLKKGEDYDKAIPVYQMTFVKANALEKEHNEIQEYQLSEILNHNNFYLPELIKTTVINLENNSSLSYTISNERFKLWCEFLNAETLEEMEKIAEKREILKEVLESMKKFSQEDYVIEYNAKERLTRSQINSARTDGEKEGEARGEARGERKGILATAKNMLADGLSEDLISKYTGLSKIDIKKLV